MKRFLLLALTSVLLAGYTSAEVKVSVTPLGSHPGRSAKRIVSTADILVDQSFSDLVTPYIDSPISSDQILQENPNVPLEDPQTGVIPAGLMDGQEGWTGYNVYSNVGACVIRTNDAGSSRENYLRTPTCDFSGSLKITFKARALLTYWYTYNGEGEEVKQAYSGSSLNVAMYTVDNRPIDIPGEYSDCLANIRLYPDQGWCEVTVEVDNLSAYNNAFIDFSTLDIVEIDDIKITSSADKFIAAPVIESVTDVTNTSFTINIEPVRKAYNYYVYLFVLKGYDETGEPIYEPAPTEEDRMIAEYYGIPFDEYWEMFMAEWSIDDPYFQYGIIERGLSFTFTDLDPEQQYYYGVRSHYVYQFSDLNVYEQVVLPTPEALEAVDLTSDGFTARWEPVAVADRYEVRLYGVDVMKEDTDEFCILEEYFDKSEGKTDAGINNPDELEAGLAYPYEGYADNAGWTLRDGVPLAAAGMMGMYGYEGAVVSPRLYLKGADSVTVHARVVSNDDFAYCFVMALGENRKTCFFKNREWEGYVTFPTDGKSWGNIEFIEVDGVDIFIDYVNVFRSALKGEEIYTLQSEDETDATDYSFSSLDVKNFRTFSYDVTAVKGERRSESSRMVSVDFSNTTEVEKVSEGKDREIVGIYSLSGQRLTHPCEGICVIHYNDGTVSKVITK